MRHRDDPPAVVGRALAALARSQHGVVCVRQLRALGLDSSAVHRRVAAGRLHSLHRGVYAVGHRALTPRARYHAAVLACSPAAALSYRSAASLWGLRPPSAHLEVTDRRGRAGARGIELHRSRSLVAADVARCDGIPVTSVARTLVDLAGVVGPRALARALDRAERLRLFDLDVVQDTLARSNGRRGAAALRRAIAGWRPREASASSRTASRTCSRGRASYPSRASTPS